MFHLFYTKPAEVIYHIKVDRLPNGLGPYWDIDGNKYDCRGYGKDKDGWWAWLVPYCDLHPYFYDTSGTMARRYHQAWDHYRLEIVKKES